MKSSAAEIKLLKLAENFFNTTLFDSNDEHLAELEKHFAEDITYYSFHALQEGHPDPYLIEVTGKADVSERFRKVAFARMDATDAVPALVVDALSEEDQFKIGRKCLAIKYAEYMDIVSLFFIEADDNELIRKIDILPTYAFAFNLEPPADWRGWTPRIIQIERSFDDSGNVVEEKCKYMDGTEVTDSPLKTTGKWEKNVQPFLTEEMLDRILRSKNHERLTAHYRKSVHGSIPFDIAKTKEPDWGFSADNPILMRNIPEATIYLDKLRTRFGAWFAFERIGTCRYKLTDDIIDIYELSLYGEKYCKLYICPYGEEDSTTAPRGMKLDNNWNVLPDYLM